jgi:hypothetical protein
VSPRRLPTPAGYMALTVTHETARVGDQIMTGGGPVTVTDMRAMGGLRDAVVLILATGGRLVMRTGMTVTVLRATPWPAQRRRAR